MPFPVGAALGLATGVISLFGKKKAKPYQTALSKEDIARRNVWLNYLQGKAYGPNVGQGAWGNALGVLGGYQRNPQSQFGQAGMTPGTQPGVQGQMTPTGTALAPGVGPGGRNPYMDLFRGRQQQPQVLRRQG